MRAIEINFQASQKQDLAWQHLEDKATNEVFYGGAAGGGKSYLGAAWKLYRRLRYPGSRGLTGRKVKQDIRESTLVTFLKIMGEWGLQAGVHYNYNSQLMYIEFCNGSREVFKDLGYTPSDPDYQRLGSTEFTDIWIEEAGDGVPEKAFEITMSRVRWKLHDFGLVPKALITGNPGFYWARDRYVMDKEGRPIELKPNQSYIQAFVDDNPDKAFVDLYRGNLENLNDYDKQRLLGGNWNAVPKTGAESYPDFSSLKHTTATLEVREDLPLHLTMDFNRIPHMTLLVAQLIGYQVRFIDEVCPWPPNSNTPYTVGKFCERWKHHPTKTVFLYGDPSGKNPSTITEEDIHNFSEAQRVLMENGWTVHIRMLSAAPSVSKRIEWINRIFQGKEGAMSIIVKRNLNELTEDLLFLKTAPDGTKNKKKIQNAQLGLTYEPHGHETDAMEYLICTAYHVDWQRFLMSGRKTQIHTPDYTPKGF